ncbi:hypothetical protein SIN8267_01986 [Sinobacterium norvegicum]|uniref:Uncharacterized protein n=1 Tax=Sinobacterium norvegicum TaxID=1641715 RepID=A0ABN8ENX1_9GAMM|nr:hypothetical protein [Sinobacterium norvegicum]CAH0991871.1 hypothetical protein SIN8267_01986 [Sinobacterium norvegicum]
MQLALYFFGTLFLLAACTTTSADSFADMDTANNCGCQWQGPFSWLIDEVDAVAHVTIVSHNDNSMDGKIIALYKGESLDDTIRIWGDRGYECRPPVDYFATDSQWLLAIKKIEAIPSNSFDPFNPERSFGRKGDYQLSACGAYWLKVEDNKASGNITSILDWDYNPEMNPVPLTVIADFISGNASYADIIGHSNEITSIEVMMRKSKQWLKNQQQ